MTSEYRHPAFFSNVLFVTSGFAQMPILKIYPNVIKIKIIPTLSDVISLMAPIRI